MSIPIGSVWRSKKSNHDAFAVVVLSVDGNIVTAAPKNDIEAKKSIHKFSIRRLMKEYERDGEYNENDV